MEQERKREEAELGRLHEILSSLAEAVFRGGPTAVEMMISDHLATAKDCLPP